MSRMSISQILQTVDSQPTREEKINALRHLWNPTVQSVLYHAFNPNIKFVLPEGKTPYNPNQFQGCQSHLYQEVRRLYLFVEGQADLKPIKRQQKWIELLEYVDPEDAKLMDAVKDKTIPYSSITPDLVKEAIPQIDIPLPEPVVESVTTDVKKPTRKKTVQVETNEQVL